jgi:hypothetical protein
MRVRPHQSEDLSASLAERVTPKALHKAPRCQCRVLLWPDPHR